MQLFSQKINRAVSDRESFSFNVEHESIYLIVISARCKSWWQNLKNRFGDDDLAIAIDHVPFYEFSGKRKEFATPASWNGNRLRGASKKNFYVVSFGAGTHTITYAVDGAPLVEIVELFDLGRDLGERVVNTDQPFPEAVFKGVEISGIPTTTTHGVRYYSMSKKRAAVQKSFRFSVISYTLGKIAHVVLYPDITESKTANLRASSSDTETSKIIATLPDKSTLEVIQEEVVGSWTGATNVPSLMWHKVRYQNKVGYIFSSLVEIEGQERALAIEKIRIASKKFKMDPDLMLAMAWSESKYKPYAVSRPEEKNPGKGIFQLTLEKGAREQLEKLGFPLPNPFVFDASIEGGIRYARWLYTTGYDRTTNGIDKFLAAWNAGQGVFHPMPSLILEEFKAKIKESRWLILLKMFARR